MGDESMPLGSRCKNLFSAHWRGLVLFCSPLVLLPLLFIQKPKESRYLYLICVMCIYYVTDCTKTFTTAWIPAIALPFMGILGSNKSCESYLNNVTLVFFTGYVVALSMANSKLVNRTFYALLRMIGSSPRKTHTILVFYTMFFSMWIPNAAASAIFCELAQTVLNDMAAKGVVKLTKDGQSSNEDDVPIPSNIAFAFHMSVAYAATIGGFGTLIGTVTTLALKFMYYDRFFGAPKELEFFNWLIIGLPIMIILTTVMLIYMQILFIKSSEINADNYKFEPNQEETQSFSMHEFQVIVAILSFLALILSFRPTNNGGWADKFKEKYLLETVPIGTIMWLLFVIPINYGFFKYFICKRPQNEHTLPSLVQWKFFNTEFPWDMLIVVGSGFCMYYGGKQIQFFKAAANCMEDIGKGLPPAILQLLVILGGVFFTTFGANIFVACVYVPIIMELALMVKMHPMYLALPATLACSIAYCLRVSTRANANAYDYCKYRNRHLFLCGIFLTIVAILVIWLVCMFVGGIPFKGYANDLEKNDWVWITRPPPTTAAPKTTTGVATTVTAAVPAAPA